MMSDSVLKIALYWTPLTPHGSRFSSVYAMVALACGLFLVQQFIASVCSSGFGDRDDQYLVQAINVFNIQVLPSDANSVQSVLSSPIKQRTLSQKLDNRLFQTLLVSSSVANKARILSESAPHSASWLSVVPSAALGLHLEPNEFLVALKWWLSHDLSRHYAQTPH